MILYVTKKSGREQMEARFPLPDFRTFNIKEVPNARHSQASLPLLSLNRNFAEVPNARHSQASLPLLSLNRNF